MPNMIRVYQWKSSYNPQRSTKVYNSRPGPCNSISEIPEHSWEARIQPAAAICVRFQSTQVCVKSILPTSAFLLNSRIRVIRMIPRAASRILRPWRLPYRPQLPLHFAQTLIAKSFDDGDVGKNPWRAMHSLHTDVAVRRRPESQDDHHLNQVDVRPFEAPVLLEAPIKLLYEILQKKGFIDAKTRPLPIDQVTHQDDHRIVLWYRSIAIGLLNYHSFSDNLSKVRSIVNYLLRWSAIYTLAKKHKSSSSQIIAKHTKSLAITKDGKTLAAFLTPTEISGFKRRFIPDLDPTTPEELIDMLFARLVQKRLLMERCAVKGCRERNVEMHHIKQIEKAGGKHKVRSAREVKILEALQGSLQKKHIPLCVRHHDALHMGEIFIDDLDMNVVIS